jgi:hypothetical protein
MPPKKTLRKAAPVIEVDDTDSGDHTSDQEVDTEDDSAGSLVDFVVDDDASVEYEDEEKKQSASDDEEEDIRQVELVESAVYVDGVRRSTRNRKPVERYVDSDYEELMCADADPDAALESEEAEEEAEDTEEESQLSDTSDSSSD